MTDAFKLCFLVPCRNGGQLLQQTVRSIQAARLTSSDFEIIVCDNASTDGSAEALRGSDVTILRNERNIGRVNNWNRCLEEARARGGTHALFLMVGDVLFDGNALLSLVSELKRTQVSVAMSPYCLVDQDSHVRGTKRRFLSVRPPTTLSGRLLVQKATNVGAFVFGPLQANVFSLTVNPRLAFDEADPTHTDQRATIDFIWESETPVLTWPYPVIGWRIHPGRYHMKIDWIQRIASDISLVRAVAGRCGASPDFRLVNALLFASYLRECLVLRNGLAQMFNVWGYLQATPAGISLFQTLALMLRRLVLGAHPIDLRECVL